MSTKQSFFIFQIKILRKVEKGPGTRFVFGGKCKIFPRDMPVPGIDKCKSHPLAVKLHMILLRMQYSFSQLKCLVSKKEQLYTLFWAKHPTSYTLLNRSSPFRPNMQLLPPSRKESSPREFVPWASPLARLPWLGVGKVTRRWVETCIREARKWTCYERWEIWQCTKQMAGNRKYATRKRWSSGCYI